MLGAMVFPNTSRYIRHEKDMPLRDDVEAAVEEQISDELEEDIAEICLICKESEEFAPKYYETQVLSKVMAFYDNI